VFEQYLVDLRTYRDYSTDFDAFEFTLPGQPASTGKSTAMLKAFAEDQVKRYKTSRFEAFIILIAYHNKSKNKKKSIEKCEEEYEPTKQLASATLHPLLWKQIVDIKGVT
jgi:hypothetical protein